MTAPTDSGITWPVEGQGELFPGLEYYQPATEWPFVPEWLMSDDEVHAWMHPYPLPDPGEQDTGQLAVGGWS